LLKSICVFNNKGGVGKTTLLCNLAAYIAKEKNKKVLIIDCDPQCNATAYMIAETPLEKLYSKDSGTINDVLKPLRRGKGYYADELPIIRSVGFGVDLIPGDPKFSLAEDFLSRDWVDATAGIYRGLQTTFFIRNLLTRCTGYDYVFLDVGPSLGAITRSVLIASEYFVIPMSSDIFSIRGLQNIEISVKSWAEELRRGLDAYRIREGEDFSAGADRPQVVLRFLGYVTQQYTAKTVAGKKQPVKAYERLIRKVAPGIQQHVIDVFNPDKKGVDYLLGEIPYLQSIIPMSQGATKPIFSLLSSDGVVGAHFEKVRESLKVIKRIADKVESNIKAVS
jgi:cellulose biosynthesis protein BcsQ